MAGTRQRERYPSFVGERTRGQETEINGPEDLENGLIGGCGCGERDDSSALLGKLDHIYHPKVLSFSHYLPAS
jgi:hypothetical protein